ncbi:MAG: DUF2203 domain-containing protein [Thermoprotei archaeon]
MNGRRAFTPESANKILPQVRRLVENIVVKETELDSLTDELSEVSADSMDRSTYQAKRRRLEEVTMEISRLAAELKNLGCLLKDVDLGLVDFPTLRLGEPAYLCWKIGEQSVSHWHTLYEGFAGRKPIVQDEYFSFDDEASERVS